MRLKKKMFFPKVKINVSQLLSSPAITKVSKETFVHHVSNII